MNSGIRPSWVAIEYSSFDVANMDKQSSLGILMIKGSRQSIGLLSVLCVVFVPTVVFGSQHSLLTQR